MPALAVVVLATLIAGWFLLLPQGFKELGEAASAQVLLVSNIYFWIKSWIGAGYFEPAAEVKPLLHTWSLAVEEQFYLLFPFLLLLLKRLGRRCIVPTILVLGGASFCLSVYCSYRHPSANFYFLPTRAWELLMGAFLAAIPSQQRASKPWLAEALSAAAVLAIIAAVFCYDRETRFPGITALLPCLGAALIIWANGHTLTSVGKLLALRPVVFIGQISYSLYLWHWPALVFAKYHALDPISPSRRLIVLGASMILAVLSWKFVETPFRRRLILRSRSRIFTFAAVSTAILLICGMAIFKSHGVPSRLPTAALRHVNGERLLAFDTDLSMKQALQGDFVEIGTADKDRPIDIMVWGDSHAMATLPILADLCKEHSARGVAAIHSATAPLVGYRSGKSDLLDKGIPYNSAIADFICNQRIRNVILVARWGKSSIDPVRSSMVATITALRKSGAKIWILREVPIQHWNVPDALALTIWHGGDTEKLGLPIAAYRSACQRQNPIFEDLTKQFPCVTILDPTPYFVDPSNDICRVIAHNTALYTDDNHLSSSGAMILRPLFEPIFVGIKE